MTKYGKLTTVLIAAWFVFALTASGLHLFNTGPNQPPLAFGLAVLDSPHLVSGVVCRIASASGNSQWA